MESTVVSDVKQVVLTMDVREALHFLEDPERAQEHIRGQLKGHGIEVPEGTGRGRKPHRATSTGEFKCNRCGRPFTSQQGLSMHITKTHPETLKD